MARQWLLRCGVESEKEGVIVFPGVQGALSSALLSVFRTGDMIAVDTFTYANFISLSRLAHVKLVPVAGDSQGMLPDALARTAKRLPIRGLFIMPRHSNPTAITLSAERRRDIADICRAADLIVLEDDASFATVDEQRLLPLQARIPERTLYLSGTARLIAAGLRIAYVACPEWLRAPLQAAFHHTTIKASALDVEILSELILSGRADVVLRKKCNLPGRPTNCLRRYFPSLEKAMENRCSGRFRCLKRTAGRTRWRNGRWTRVFASCIRIGILWEKESRSCAFRFRRRGRWRS